MTNIIFTDMDGVIAKYERHAYTGDYSKDASHENKPLFLRNPRYFATCKPDMIIIKAFELLNHEGVDIIVLSNVVNHAIAEKHATDKNEWIKKYIPFVKEFYPITVPKITFVTETLLKRSATNTDILVSDYNNDLKPWEQGGGTGIKYLNGVNSPESFAGIKVSHEWTPEQITEKLLNTIKTNQIKIQGDKT